MKQYLSQLTGFRGLAALMVFFTHAANHEFIPKFLGVGYGQIGVIYFFILSGFLMSYLYIDKEMSLKSTFNFLISRFSRVVPLFYVAIIIYVFFGTYLVDGIGYSLSQTALIKQSFMLINASSIMWTIPVEIRYYLLFVVIWLLYGLKINKWLLLIACLSLSIHSVFIFITEDEVIRSFGMYALYFNLGTAVAFIVKNKSLHQLLNKTPIWVVAAIFTISMLNFPIIRFRLGYYHGPWLDGITLILSLSTFVFVAVNHPFFKFLNNKIFQKSGEISYGVYLLHYPLMLLLDQYVGANILLFIPLCIVTYFICATSYKYFEVPIARFIKKRFSIV